MSEPNGKTLLEVKGLRVSYNRVVEAVRGVDLEVKDGSITGLIGTNGAGKTTTLLALAGPMGGDLQITAGTVEFDGQRTERMRPHQVARVGLTLIPERQKIWPNLSVDENLRASVLKNERSMSLDEVFDLFPVLKDRRKLIAGYLSGGERQMLAIAMALVGGPKLVLVDEMSLGLSPAVTQQVAQVIRHLRAEAGVSFLVVEQNASLAMALVDYAYVMQHGEIVLEGNPGSLYDNTRFRDVYLGLDVDAQSRSYGDAMAGAPGGEGHGG